MSVVGPMTRLRLVPGHLRADVASIWRRLEQSAPERPLACSWDWTETWLDHYGATVPHRFAIGSHRQKRARDIREAGLQDIPGIGPARKRALLRHFGTLKAIERASLADLSQVPGVSSETARRIHDYFHESSR